MESIVKQAIANPKCFRLVKTLLGFAITRDGLNLFVISNDEAEKFQAIKKQSIIWTA